MGNIFKHKMFRLNHLNSHFAPHLSASSPNLVKTTMYDKVALVELNPPSKLIFLSYPLIKALGDELTRLEKDPAVSVVVLTGKRGSSSFATGADINELKA